MLLNKNLKYLDRETKEDSINKVLMLLHEVADYTRNELHPLGIWDNELTLELLNFCPTFGVNAFSSCSILENVFALNPTALPL